MKQKIHAVILSVMLLVAGELQATPEDCFQEYGTTLAHLTPYVQQALEDALKSQESGDTLTRGGWATTLDDTLSEYINSFADQMHVSDHQRKILSEIFNRAVVAAFKAMADIEIATPIKPSTLIHATCKAYIAKFLDENVSKLLRIFIFSCYHNLSESLNREDREHDGQNNSAA